MIQAIEDINAIVKELAIVRLKTEGRVDGRVAKGIANRIIQVSGERLLKLEHTISEQGKALEEKDAAIAEKEAVIAEKDAVIDADVSVSLNWRRSWPATRSTTARQPLRQQAATAAFLHR